MLINSLPLWQIHVPNSTGMLIFSEQGCGKYILIDSTQRYNLAGEGCRKGYNGELVRIDSASQQNYIQNWLNTLRRCLSKHIGFIMGI